MKTDPGQVEQVILNLSTEDITITPDGGKGDGFVLPSGAYVRLAVSDTGTGMDRAARDRETEEP